MTFAYRKSATTLVADFLGKGGVGKNKFFPVTNNTFRIVLKKCCSVLQYLTKKKKKFIVLWYLIQSQARSLC